MASGGKNFNYFPETLSYKLATCQHIQGVHTCRVLEGERETLSPMDSPLVILAKALKISVLPVAIHP